MSLKLSDMQFRIPQQFLNQGYDSVAGDQTAGGTGFPLYASLLGTEVELDAAAALQLSNTANSTLYGGLYKYVNFFSAGANTIAAGQACFWGSSQTGANIFANDGSQYAVSIDGSASIGDGFFAGVALVVGAAACQANPTGTSPQFGWIQTAGLASIIYKTTPTSTTIGTLVVVVTTAVNFDALTDATDSTSLGGLIKRSVGVAAEAPQSATIKRALIWERNKIF
jgi:hypothetical protein